MTQWLPGWDVDLGTVDVPTEAAAGAPLLPVMLWRFLTVAIAPRNVSRIVKGLLLTHFLIGVEDDQKGQTKDRQHHPSCDGNKPI